MENSIKQWMLEIPQLKNSKVKQLVYAKMYEVEKSTGDISVGHEEIAKSIGKDRRNTTRAINDLVNDKLLIITKPAVKSANPINRRAAHYKVVIPKYIEGEEMKVGLSEAVSYQTIRANEELVQYVESIQSKFPPETYELLLRWISEPLKNGTYINYTIERFKLNINDLYKFCTVNGHVDWEKFNAHIRRAYKRAGVVLIYEKDKSATVEQNESTKRL